MGEQDYKMAVEPEALPVGNIFRAVAVMTVLIALAVGFTFPIVNRSVQDASFNAVSENPAYPALRESRLDAVRKLTQYEVDASTGEVQIPIDRAMEILVNEERAAGSRVYYSEFPTPEQ